MAIGIDPERIECRKELEKLIRQLDVLILRKNIYGAEAGKSFPSWSEADDIHLNNILNKMKNNKSFRICIPDFIQYIIRADKADMEDVFRKLLDCLPGQGPVYRVNNFAVFMMQDVKKLFLAESSKYLQLLYENEKHRPELEKEFYCWIQGYRCESNAPDVFLAILEGNNLCCTLLFNAWWKSGHMLQSGRWGCREYSKILCVHNGRTARRLLWGSSKGMVL